MTDIVERLRNDDVVWGVRPSLVFEAADEIERLRWENANMEKLWGKSEGTWMEIRDKEDAEIERLREALHTIGYGPPHEGEPLDLLNQFVDLARAALKEKE